MIPLAVGFNVDFLWYPIGHEEFVHAFFSTVSYHLEPEGWGTRFPLVMTHLYQGKLPLSDVPQAVDEVRTIRRELAGFPPDKVIWDIDDLSKEPPWKGDISPSITSLANYFVTSDGKDLFDVLLQALKDAQDIQSDVEILDL